MKRSNGQHRGSAFWEAVFVLAVLGVVVAVLLPVFKRGREPHRNYCQSNLKQIMLGMRQYVQDYDEKYPLVASGTKANSGKPKDLSAFGWADALQPYLKSTQIFQCSSQKNAPAKGEPAQLQYTDYWFNAGLSGVEEKKVDEVATTITLGDGNDGADSTDARYHLMSIPQKWRDGKSSPLYRHQDAGGANFAFADGHVKWLQGRDWKSDLDFGGNTRATFRLKPID